MKIQYLWNGIYSFTAFIFGIIAQREGWITITDAELSLTYLAVLVVVGLSMAVFFLAAYALDLRKERRERR